MQAYLFVHFKEKRTPDGEQVYFALSRDGFHWEAVNGGQPVLWSYLGDRGVRDFTVTRAKNGTFYIIATDLSLAYGMPGKYNGSWAEIAVNGSHAFSLWESDDLVHWSRQRLIDPGAEELGCMWAPDIIYDRRQDDYLLHWSSPDKRENFDEKAIYYSRTKDFKHFSKPLTLYRKPGCGVIDSAMYEENGQYYLFVKSEKDPETIILLKSDRITGPFERVSAFDACMQGLAQGQYEAPTAFQTEDGRWCLFLDYYGVPGRGQGYVPFVADSLKSGVFTRSDAAFSFPYGFKHGTVLTLTLEEYARLKAVDEWPEVPG